MQKLWWVQQVLQVNQYNNEFEFDVTKIINGTDVDFAAWQEGSPTQGYRPGINLIELTKLS